MSNKKKLIIGGIVLLLIIAAVMYYYRDKWMPKKATEKTAEQLKAEQDAAASNGQAQSTSPYVQDSLQSMAVDTSGNTSQPSSNAIPSHAVAGPTVKPPVFSQTQVAAATRNTSSAAAAVKYAAPNGGMQMQSL